MRIRPAILILLAFILAPFSGISQNMEFDHLNMSEFLSRRTVSTIKKDRYGFMWFGTYEGLLRYDGYEIKEFLKNEDNEFHPKRIDVRSLCQTAEGALMAGTLNHGLFVFDHLTEKFENYQFNPSDSQSISDNFVSCIIQDKQKRIWIGTERGANIFDLESRTFTRVYPFGKKGHVNSIVEARNGVLWFYGGNNVARLSPGSSTFQLIPVSDNPKLKDIHVVQGTMIIDDNDILWIGNKVEGLSWLNTVTLKPENLIPDHHAVTNNLVYCMINDYQNQTWIGTDGGGIYLYNSITKSVRKVVHDKRYSSSLAGNAIHSLYESEPGLVWIGVFGNGVDIYKKNKKKCKWYTERTEPNYGLNQKSVLSFIEDEKGVIYAGTDGGGLNRIDLNTEKFEYLTEENNDICANVVKSLLKGKQNTLYMGSYRKGLCVLNTSNGKKKNFNSLNNSLLKDNIWTMCKSPDGDIWIGMLIGGIAVLDIKSDKIVSAPIDPEIEAELSKTTINCIIIDSKKRIWIGTDNKGIVVYNYKTKSTKKIVAGDKTGISSNEIRDILEDSQNRIWIGTKNGLELFDEENVRFSMAEPEGGKIGSVAAILEDNNHDLWLSGDNGITFYDQQADRIYLFNEEDGLKKAQFNGCSKLKTRDGHILFGSTEGFAVFHPDELVFNNAIPKVFVTDFKVFNKSVSTGQEYKGRTYFTKTLLEKPEITLSHKDNIFSIKFSALSYLAPLKNKFAYKLEGFDEDWIYTNGTNRSVTYMNLEPGSYKFRVKASNNDGFWNENGTFLSIIVLPPWYKTIFFKISCFLFLLFSVIGIIYIRTRNIKERNILLEEQVSKRTSELNNANHNLISKNEEILRINDLLKAINEELQDKSERIIQQQDEILKQKENLERLNLTKDKLLSIIAHDLRNPITALSVLTRFLEKEFPDASHSQKELISKIELSSERIKSLVLNLLDWAKSQTEDLKVREEKIAIYDIIEENIQLHLSQASQKSISLTATIKPGYFLIGDYNMINTIIRNILSNNIKYTERGGKVTIHCKPGKEGFIKLIFADTGVGMAPEIVSRLFKPDFAVSTKGTENEVGTGLGMLIAREFIDLNKGNIQVLSESGIGSSFQLELPGGFETNTEKENPSQIVYQNEEGVFDSFISENLKGKKILVLDDDGDIRMTLSLLLRKYFEVTEATNVKEGLAIAEKESPDLIISDIIMPGENGISFCNNMKNSKQTSHIPIILLTGQRSEEMHLEGLVAGADAFITKPFDKKIFLTTINNILTTNDKLKLRFSSDPSLLASDLASTDLDKQLLSKTVEVIEGNINNEELNGDFLSKELGISKSLLYAKLNKLSGQTINEFIRIIRLKKSTRLLLEGNMTISQIAWETGFNSPSYFTRSFTKYFGVAPKEYVMKAKSLGNLTE